MKSRIDAKLYRCADCNKLTRDTGYGEYLLGLCKGCLMVAELENSLSDGDITPEEFNQKLKEIEK